MVAELEKQFGNKLNIELIKGDRGIFDVKLNGSLIYSKHKLDRFPNPGEVGRLIEQQSTRPG